MKLLYCILGSAILALLNNPVFSEARFAIHMKYLFVILFIRLVNILSLFGFILLIIFSSILIIRNIPKEK